MGVLSLKKITGSEGLNLGSVARDITSNPILAGLAGLALAPMTAGTSLAFLGASPLAAAATVGGIGALAHGSLSKGLQAGLSAYGGSAIGQGLGAVGAPGAQNAMLANAPMDLTNEQLVGQLAKPSASTALAEGLTATAKDPMATLKAIGSGSALKGAGIVAAPLLLGGAADQQKLQAPPQSPGMIRPYEFTRNPLAPAAGATPSNRFGARMVGTQYTPDDDTSERLWFDQYWTPATPYEAPGPEYKKYASGGPIEQMSQANSVGLNTGYPMADISQGGYATPWQAPISRNVVQDSSDAPVNSFSGEPMNLAAGGLGSLGGYSDGGRMLKGPGDGMSDDIPATIGGKRPARLADGEFVVPADVVSHLGNGSTDAGARQLYKMMDRVRQQRTGKKKQAPEVNPRRAMPA